MATRLVNTSDPLGARTWQSMYVLDRPPSRRGGLIFPIEGNRWMVTLFGAHGDHPPTDDAGFLQFREVPARAGPARRARGGARRVTDITTFGSPPASGATTSGWRAFRRASS